MLNPAHRTLARIAPRGHWSSLLGPGARGRQVEREFVKHFRISLASGQLFWRELGEMQVWN
jgi:hypothetical protein